MGSVYKKVTPQQLLGDLFLPGHELHVCVVRGRLADLREMIATVTQANLEKGSLWGTPLEVAVWIHRAPAVELLLQAGADPYRHTASDLSDPEFTPLTLAAALGYRDLVRLLLQGAPIEHVVRVEESSDPCCLIRAATFGRIPVILDLLEWFPAWPQPILDSCLISASRAWQVHSVRLFLARATFERHVLDDALRMAIHADRLLEVGCADIKDLRIDASAVVEQQELMELLISAGADPDYAPKRDPLVTRAASSLDATAALRTLLEKGADVDATNHSGLTALHKLGSPVNIFTRPGERELHETGVRLLLKHGASVVKPGPVGDTPLHAAAYGSRLDLFRFYLRFCCTTPTEEASLLMNMESTEYDTLLHFAAGGGKTDIVEFLLDRGLDVNARNEHGWSPLMCAVAAARRFYVDRLFKGVESIVKVSQLLLSRGADPKVMTQEGWTPLHLLAMYYDDGHDELVVSLARRLIDGGADIHMRAISPRRTVRGWSRGEERNHWGWEPDVPSGLTQRVGDTRQPRPPPETALAMAARNGALGVVQAFVTQGMPRVVLAPDEVSPARIAVESSRASRDSDVRGEICDLLINAGYGY